LKLWINEKEVTVSDGLSVLKACKEAGITIPTLCHDERLTAHGACRLCVVEVEGARNLQTSCTLKASEGMKIKTHSDKVIKARTEILDLLFSNHPNDCLNCKKSGKCKLQDYCYEYGIKDGSYRVLGRKRYEMDRTNKFYNYDPEKCILCEKCVKMCGELQCTNAIGLENRGFDTKVATPNDIKLENSKCVSCGNCVSVCPTGALTPKKQNYRMWEVQRTVTTCGYCGVGCQLELLTKNNKVVGVEPHQGAPSNDGLLCVKGRFSYNFINHPDRLKTPLIRKDGVLTPASWDEALNLIADKIRTIKSESGPDSIAGLSSARCTNEDNYLFQKMLRGVIGTNNVDHCARL